MKIQYIELSIKARLKARFGFVLPTICWWSFRVPLSFGGVVGYQLSVGGVLGYPLSVGGVLGVTKLLIIACSHSRIHTHELPLAYLHHSIITITSLDCSFQSPLSLQGHLTPTHFCFAVPGTLLDRVMRIFAMFGILRQNLFNPS